MVSYGSTRSLSSPGLGEVLPWICAKYSINVVALSAFFALFLSLGANAYLGLLLANMRQRYLRDIQQGVIRT